MFVILNDKVGLAVAIGPFDTYTQALEYRDRYLPSCSILDLVTPRS